MKVVVLGNPNGWYVQQICLAAEHRGLQPETATWSDLMASTGTAAPTSVATQSAFASEKTRDGFPISKQSEPVCLAGEGQPSAIIVRNMPIGTLEQTIFRMNALAAAERAGVRVVNAARCLEISIDKWLTLDLLSQQGLAVPPTIACQTRVAAMEAWEHLGNDCVIKPVFGGEGRGIVRVTDPDMAWRVFSTIEQTRSLIYIQQYYDDLSLDLRVLCLGDQTITVRRTNPLDWRLNASRGGRTEPYEATAAQLQLAQRAQQIVGGEFLGVDIVQSAQFGDRILEVNAVPGWKSLAKCTPIDIPGMLMDTIIEQCNR